ncbi:MAG: UDP-N-acetylmuramoyl-tripeptide--D-alanyl-D-alanine ligase [Clostridiales bacterium]|nr:UDP-N-acetylmuramoyl-tripeptide--D-alanyl-D-alanine ligase [Clostridiales bacterium]
MTEALYRGIAGLVPVLVSLFAARGIFHLFQLESYQFPGYIRSVRRNPVQAWAPGFAAAAVSLGLLAVLWKLYESIQNLAAQIAVIAGFLALAVCIGYLTARLLKVNIAKKPFVYTARVKRLYGFCFVLLGALSYYLSLTGSVIIGSIWPVSLPGLIAACGFIAWGLEKFISECYFRSARRKLLSQTDLIRIGITGSYGKTSVKYILGTILAEKYSVLVTPKSYNTPMGVSRTIRERLLPSHQVFVAEMGARHVGDIRELCRLVKPQIGILTSVGPQHLDTFKTVERVTKTKYELIETLSEDGHSFFTDDGAVCRQLYDKTKKPKTLTGQTPGNADVWSENTEVSPEGSAFDICLKNGERLHVATRLLGEHNIQNILTAAAVARQLGLTKQQILRGISRIEPIQSRMELIRNPNSYTIINDGFNANPVSAKASLAVLSRFPGRRIVITPGMVELGSEEAGYNKAFGAQIAKAADIAVIVGKKRVQPILDGLREEGFPDENIYQVSSLEESTEVLRRLANKGDTVLYENDLPDNYQEN